MNILWGLLFFSEVFLNVGCFISDKDFCLPFGSPAALFGCPNTRITLIPDSG